MSKNLAASGISIDDVFDKLGARTQEAERAMNDAMKNLDSSDPAAMLKFQRVLTKWNLATEVQTSSIKSIRDVIRSVIQKV